MKDLDECGLNKTELDKFLGYLERMGPHTAEVIRMDRRPRPDGAGGMTTRAPETWEEAHEVMVESEAIKAGTRAQTMSRTGYQQTGPPQNQNNDWWKSSGWENDKHGNKQGGQFGGGKGKGKSKGKDKGKEDALEGLSEAQKAKVRPAPARDDARAHAVGAPPVSRAY